MKHHICILFIAIVLFACKKDKKVHQETNTQTSQTTAPQSYVDTIKPGSYFPVYPGSWFTYKKNDSTVFTNTVSATYLPLSVKITNSNTTSYVPYYNGAPVIRYQRVQGSIYSSEPYLYTFLPQTPGNYRTKLNPGECNGHTISSWPHYCNAEYLTNIQRSVNSAGDSIIIATVTTERFYEGGSSSLIWGYSYIEYTKDIGITHYYRIDNFDESSGIPVYEPDTVETLRLVGYHIGPH